MRRDAEGMVNLSAGRETGGEEGGGGQRALNTTDKQDVGILAGKCVEGGERLQ